ncbi:MAG: hypothetical protein ACYC96_06690 [Fimbriimonadaceae bacterium]
MKYTHFYSALATAALAAPAFSQGSWVFAPGLTSTPYPSPTTFLDTSNVGITAWGYDVQNGYSEVDTQSTWNPGTPTSHELYGKYTSGNVSETGLGLAIVNGSDTDFEINKNEFIQFDLTNAINAYGNTFDIGFGSLQSGEGYSLFGSATAASPFTRLASGYGNNTSYLSVNLQSNKFIEVSAYGSAGADTLVLNSFRRTPGASPEPFTIGLGIAGVCIAARRRLKGKAGSAA